MGIKKANKTKEILKNRHDNLNPNWKGDNVSYGALHNYMKSRIPKPKYCNLCKIKSPFDLTNISGLYKRNKNDWKWMCRSCHMKEDGRLKKFIKVNK
jgi:hypothetical protein